MCSTNGARRLLYLVKHQHGSSCARDWVRDGDPCPYCRVGRIEGFVPPGGDDSQLSVICSRHPQCRYFRLVLVRATEEDAKPDASSS